MANIGTLTAQIGLNTKALRTDVNRAGNMFGGLQKKATGSLGAITSSIGKMAAAFGVVAGGAAVVGLFKNMIKVGADFQHTMATVGGVMRATGDEMKNLTAIAKEMGETTEWSASQAGDALKFLGMAGFNASEAAQALPGVLDLATAGNIELGRAADIASNALTAMGLPVKELTRVNDVFVGTITRSNTNMEMMAESFKYAAPVAKAYGYSVEDLSGLIGKLGDAGIQGSMAGTQLAMAIQKSSDIAKEFGFESSELTSVLESLRATGMETTDIMKLFGLRAGRAVGVLVDRIPDVRKFQDTLRDTGGEAAKLANIMRSTVKGSFAELRSIIQSVQIAVFEGFAGSLQETVKSLITWIRRNKDELVALFVALSRGALETVTTVGSVLKIMGGFIEGIAHVFKTTEASIWETQQTVEHSGMIMRRALEQAPGMISWEGFKLAMGNIGEALQFIFTSAGAVVGAVLEAIVQGVSNIAGGLQHLLEGFAKIATADISGAIVSFDKLRASISETGTDFVSTFESAFNKIDQSWDDFMIAFEGRSLTDIIKDQFQAAEWLETIDERTKLLSKTMLDNLTAAGVELKGTIAEQMQMAMVLYYQPVESASEKVSAAILKSRDDFAMAMTKMSEDSISFVDTVQDSAAKEFEIWKSRHTHLIDLIKRAAKARQDEERQSSTRTIETAEALIRKEYELWKKRRKQSTELLKEAAKDRETLEGQSSIKSIETAEQREKKISGVIKASYETQRSTAEQAYDSVAQTASRTSEETTQVVKNALAQQQREVQDSAKKRVSAWEWAEKNISGFADQEITWRTKMEQAAAIKSIETVTDREGDIIKVIEASFDAQEVAAGTAFSSMLSSAGEFAVGFVQRMRQLREDLISIWQQIMMDIQTFIVDFIWDPHSANEFAEGVYQRMVQLREALKAVWQGIAADFRLYIIEYILAQIEAIIAEIQGRALQGIPAQPAPRGSRDTERRGYPPMARIAAIQPALATAPASSAITNFNLYFEGPVTSADFVHTTLLPAIEKAVELEEARSVRKTHLETGDGNVIYG